MDNLKVACINARGLNDETKRERLYTWLKEKKIGIALVQETFCVKEFIKVFDKGWKGPIYHAYSDSCHSRGVCIIIDENVNCNIINSHRTEDGRRIMVNATIDDTDISIVSLYAPNNMRDRLDFFHKTHHWINKNALFQNSLLISGDMNCCLRDIDRHPVSNVNDYSKKAFLKLINELDLNDCWPLISDRPGYTYYDKRTGSKSRIDYILTSKILPFTLNTMSIVKCTVSDHETLIAGFKTVSQKRGKGYWKLNNSLLQDSKYKMAVKSIIRETINELSDIKSHRLTWELMKIRVKEYSIQYSVSKARSQKSNIAYIESKIDIIRDKLDVVDTSLSVPYSRKLINEKCKLEDELKMIQQNKSRGNIIRSRVKWIEEGERSTHYFFSLEKGRQSNNVIKRVSTQENISVKSEDILNDIKAFYKKLYSKDDIPSKDVDDYFRSITNCKELSKLEKELCDKDITTKEIKDAICKIRNNRSPGPDGLSPEFYKVFHDDLCELYFDMLKETFRYGELPDSLKWAIITLIYKKGEKDNLKNYRPISLTNYDYKILAYILAKRLQCVIKSIINVDQSGYIKGRYIGCNIRVLEDIIDYSATLQIDSSLICLDFEKAFDSVNWYFMLSALKKFNFGNNFIKWVEILYNDPKISVKNNGHISSKFTAERGIRQGCPVSALLFLLVVEIMAIKIRECQDIQGFDIGNCNFKLSQYADDTTLMLSNIESIKNAVHIISSFSCMSGLKLNIDKCEGMWIGRKRDFVPVCEGIHFTEDPLKCLGIYIGGNNETRYDLNWKKKLEQFDQVLERWKNRNLTIFGKCLILKSLGISQLVFNMSLLEIKPETLKHINKSMYDFMWNSRDRIKRNVLIGDYHKGGIRMIDLDNKVKSLRASWMSRIAVDKDAKWTCIYRHFLGNIGLRIEHTFLMNITDIKMFTCLSSLPAFYLNMLTSFNEAKTNMALANMGNDQFLSQILWGNNLFLQKGKCLYFKNWITSNIIFVKDVFDSDGKFLDENTILTKLNCTSNWMCEYSSVKRVVTKLAKRFMCTNSSHISSDNIYKNTMYFVQNNRRLEIDKLSAKLYYNILTDKKSVNNYTEKVWQRTFDVILYESDWNIIYRNKVWNMPVKKIAEFNYKVIHLLLNCKLHVNRWKKDVSPQCMYCGETETIQHLLYDCSENTSIWLNVSKSLNLDIKWKHIVIGSVTKNDIWIIRNIIISTIAFCIYKVRVQNDLKKIYVSYENRVKYEYMKETYLLQLLQKSSKYYNLIKKVFEEW